ncbi:MAG TPA: glycosyltransferase family 39 protein [Planctomycetota bacterium]|nr:glycosyltransferase family 39 protein [Planctomycetota bacterium]
MEQLPRERQDRALLAIILLAFVLRLVYVLAAGLPDAPNGPDAPLYDKLAWRLITEGKYYAEDHLNRISQANRPVLFPFVLGGIYRMFGRGPTAPRIFQCVLGALTCGVAFALAKELFGRRAAILAGIGTAIFPQFIYYTGTLTTETLHVFLLTSAAFLLVKGRGEPRVRPGDHTDRPYGGMTVTGKPAGANTTVRPYDVKQWVASLAWWPAAGACLGLAVLARSAAVGLVAVLLPWLLIVAENKRMAIVRFALIAVGFAIVLAPWVIRNHREFNAFVPATTEGGYTFWVTNNDRATGGGECFLPDDVRPFRGTNELQADRLFYRMAFRWIGEHPGRFVELLGAKFVRLWRPWPHASEVGVKEAVVAGVSFVPVLVLAVWGAITARRRWRDLLLFYLVIGYTTGICCLYMAITRYRAPLMPLLLVLAGFMADELTKRRMKTSS